MTALTNRYDFVYFFDVANGNPNGDPDAGNLPRMDSGNRPGPRLRRIHQAQDPELCCRCCANGMDGHAIYVTENAILNDEHRKAYKAIRPEDKKVETAKALSPQNDPESAKLRDWMCANFFDVRAFGAVMSTGINCGQVRGPLQFVFGRSLRPSCRSKSPSRAWLRPTRPRRKSVPKGRATTSEATTAPWDASTLFLMAFIVCTPSSTPSLRKKRGSAPKIWS